MTSKIEPIKNLTKPGTNLCMCVRWMKREKKERKKRREEERGKNDKIILGRRSLGCCWCFWCRVCSTARVDLVEIVRHRRVLLYPWYDVIWLQCLHSIEVQIYLFAVTMTTTLQRSHLETLLAIPCKREWDVDENKKACDRIEIENFSLYLLFFPAR
jgi:hypothetical protein